MVAHFNESPALLLKSGPALRGFMECLNESSTIVRCNICHCLPVA